MNQKWILYEDQDIIVCRKAAGIATQTSRVGQADMASEVANYLSRAADGGVKRQAPYVGVVHRLDQPVEGILVFAKNKTAAAKLSGQIAGEQAEKYYYAVVCGRDLAKEGDLEDYLVKDGRTNRSDVAPPEAKGARRAKLHYDILEERDEADGKIALARIRLYTGRHHQIRVQMSHAGMSLLGDYKYADAETMRRSERLQIKEIALCAYRLVFWHPGTGRRMQFQIEPEGKGFQIFRFQEA